MSIEIGQLSIKSNVIQQAPGEGGPLPVPADAPEGEAVFDAQARADLLAECRALVLDLLERAKER
ncbi:hypothetical protein PPN31114_00650 [Pandoraea pneumonica]|jgi:hypothetical protein|uniref:Uncharacterized protein n=1 Tax=Pandoraea pneumonica TaxID=2508299 RepID=A0A5E4SB84_9BURK|nr:DUF5908 family protein [Pandoraea pneumonica]VVD71834.1 hypothetical protein PPN31114_00650 [Pandoraea pneumonica]